MIALVNSTAAMRLRTFDKLRHELEHFAANKELIRNLVWIAKEELERPLSLLNRRPVVRAHPTLQDAELGADAACGGIQGQLRRRRASNAGHQMMSCCEP